jgi:DNA-binding NarL/FixJ family response regulator
MYDVSCEESFVRTVSFTLERRINNDMRERVAVKVFLADYSIMVRQSVAAMLAAHGLNIVGQAATTEGALNGIQAAHPDVVVLDTQLEGGNGLQVLPAVRETNPGIAFVVFSIHTSPALRLEYLSAGANCFLDKATEFRQLLNAVTKTGPSPNAYALALASERAAWQVLHGLSLTDSTYAQALSEWQAAADRIGIEAEKLLMRQTPSSDSSL